MPEESSQSALGPGRPRVCSVEHPWAVSCGQNDGPKETNSPTLNLWLWDLTRQSGVCRCS